MSTQTPEKISAVSISLMTERLHRMKLERESPVEDDLTDPAKLAEFQRRTALEWNLVEDAATTLTTKLLIVDLLGMAAVAWTRWLGSQGVTPLEGFASDVQRMRDVEGGKK